MKSKEELDALKEEVNKVNEKICELTPEELEQVTGGVAPSNIRFVAHDVNEMKGIIVG